MGMNDDGLTPREHSELRDIVLAGTQRIRPAGANRNRIIAGALALVLIGAVSGAAVTTAAIFGSQTTATLPTPSPVERPTVTPSPTPTPAPTVSPSPVPPPASDGVTAFGGDCANALTLDEVAAVTGVGMVLHEPAWRSGAEGLQGGLVCTWTDPTGYASPTVRLITYPASVVPADVQEAASACDGADYQCAVSGTAGDTWLYLSVTPTVEETAGRGLWEAAASRASGFAAPRSEPRTADWWPATSCEQLEQDVDLQAATGWESIAYAPPQYDAGPSPFTLPERVGGVSWCEFSGTPAAGGSSGASISIRLIPGGGEYFGRIAASEGAVPVEVEGALEAAAVADDDLWEGHFAMTAATDGVNLVIVGVSVLDESTDGAPIASAVLAAM